MPDQSEEDRLRWTIDQMEQWLADHQDALEEIADLRRKNVRLFTALNRMREKMRQCQTELQQLKYLLDRNNG